MIAIDGWKQAEQLQQSVSDESLMRLAAKGDARGMEGLAQRYQKPIHRFLTRFLDASDDAEQATLNVFIRAWEHAPRFQFRAKVSTWLFRIAVNIARDMHDSRMRRPRSEAFPSEERFGAMVSGNAETEVLDKIECDERYAQIQQALKSLSETDRLLIVLYYFQECTYEEMHEISGLSYTVLKTRLSRARQRLRALLGADTER